MSVDFAYMRRSVDAAFDLVVRDKSAWSKFDLTTEGFYRSFAALFIVIPLNIVIDVLVTQTAVIERAREGHPIVDQAYTLGDAIFSTLTICLQWLIFPVAMIFLLRFLELSHRYAALIIAHNWATVVIWLFRLPAFLLYSAGWITLAQASDLYFVVLIFSLYYRFYIAQTALDTNWSLAAGIAMIDFLLQVNFQFALSHVWDLWLPSGS